MFTILIVSLMLAGILLGCMVFSRLHNSKPLRVAGILQKAATFVLLFVMGAWLGGNEAFWAEIGVIGLRGILFAAATIAGSVLGACLVSRIVFDVNSKSQ